MRVKVTDNKSICIWRDDSSSNGLSRHASLLAFVQKSFGIVNAKLTYLDDEREFITIRDYISIASNVCWWVGKATHQLMDEALKLGAHRLSNASRDSLVDLFEEPSLDESVSDELHILTERLRNENTVIIDSAVDHCVDRITLTEAVIPYEFKSIDSVQEALATFKLCKQSIAKVRGDIEGNINVLSGSCI